MTKNKTLLLVNDDKIISKLETQNIESNITFLFPIEEFTVGLTKAYKIEEIKHEAFIFINRILDNESIEKLRTMLSNLPENIKGIVFDDIGVLNILLDLNIDICKILFLNHLNCNYKSINAYLDYVDSVVVSTDITTEEIDEILANANKPLVLYTFGHVNIMYSRRTLLTNYNKYFHKEAPLISSLDEAMSHKKFKIIENEYGTVIYTSEPYNGLYLREKDNVLYNLINTVFLSDEEILAILDSNDNLEVKYPYKYLNDEKMIVKLKEEEK